MSVENPDDLLRRMLPNFMHGFDAWMAKYAKMELENAFLKAQVEQMEDVADENETLKSEKAALMVELQRRIADKEIDQ